jgi:NAD(P)-dependent dehydrogenase (short-subunit alcohol dehydrogenase family)
VAGHFVFPVIGAYAASKFALEAISDTLRIELAPFGVRVVTVMPHAGATAIWETSQRRGATLLQGSQENPYQSLMVSVERFFKQTATKGYQPEFFANKIRKILNVARPRSRYAISAQARLLIFFHRWLPNAIWDWLVRQTLRW